MDAAPTEAGYSDLWVHAADGRRLHARSYGGGSAAALPVVCLPGLSRGAADFDALARALRTGAEFDRQIIAVDYRGRGLSDHDPDPTRYSVPVELEDLLTLLASAGIGRAVFVGTSRGGLITMMLAGTKPDLIAGAILNDIGPRIEVAGLLRIKSYIGRLGRPRNLEEAVAILRGLFSDQFPALTAAEWRDWAAATWTAGDGGLVLGYDPALANTLEPIQPGMDLPELWPLFEALARTPVLAIRGALSDLLSEETLARMATASPQVETLTVPGQGHTPLLYGTTVFERIRAFLARCDQAG